MVIDRQSRSGTFYMLERAAFNLARDFQPHNTTNKLDIENAVFDMKSSVDTSEDDPVLQAELALQ